MEKKVSLQMYDCFVVTMCLSNVDNKVKGLETCDGRGLL